MKSGTDAKTVKVVPNIEEEDSLHSFEVFRGLSRADVNRIVGAGIIRSIDRGKTLFRKGDTGKDVYLVLKGRIQIVDEYDSHRKVLAELESGEFFGEMSMVERAHTRSVHAVAKELSQILVLGNDALNKLIDTKLPKRFLKNIIGMLCHRIHVNKGLYMRARYNDRSAKNVNWQG